MSSAGVDFRQDYSDALAGLQDDDGNDDGDGEPSRLVNSTSQLLDLIDPVVRLVGTGRKKVDYFRTSSLLAAGTFPKAPTPFRTFASPDNNTAFHLNRDHVGRQLQLDAAVTLFKIPDLLRALQTYLHRHQEGSQLSSLDIGGRIPAANTHLPFHKIEVWHSVWIQSRSFHNQDNILEPETVNAAPPDSHWEMGRRDMVIVNHDLKYKWPKSGIEGALENITLLLFLNPLRPYHLSTLHDIPSSSQPWTASSPRNYRFSGLRSKVRHHSPADQQTQCRLSRASFRYVSAQASKKSGWIPDGGHYTSRSPPCGR